MLRGSSFNCKDTNKIAASTRENDGRSCTGRGEETAYPWASKQKVAELRLSRKRPQESQAKPVLVLLSTNVVRGVPRIHAETFLPHVSCARTFPTRLY